MDDHVTLNESLLHQKTSDDGMLPRNIGRIAFLWRYALLMFLLAMISIGAKIAVRRSLDPDTRTVGVILGEITLIIAMLYFVYYLVRYVLLARARDIGIHGAFTLLMFVPYLNLAYGFFLLLVPANSFGRREHEVIEPATTSENPMTDVGE